ncbi:MAG TPA: DUF6582 domain-containing protein [Candidatus Limnocylindria bacterium]|jgi:hypothetical protein|nr:DUF6582 domain-containing protein [Candidatus Limnocylindria bacterium]
MPELSTRDRDKLDRDQFAYVDREGGEHLPINDESHVRNAISRFNQTDFDSKTAKEEAARKILKAAKRHDIEVDEDSDVVKATR